MSTAANRNPGWFLVGFGLLSIGMVVAVYRHWGQERSVKEGEARVQLEAIAESKAQLVEMWRRERLADADAVASDPFLLAALDRAVATGGDRLHQRQLRGWMEALRATHPYANLILTGRKGQVVMSVGAVAGHAEHYATVAREAMEARTTVLRDSHSDAGLPFAHLGLNIPLRRPGRNEMIGALLIGIDPRDNLNLLLGGWPAASPTGEVLLVRREGNQVVFLRDPRHSKGSGLGLRLPLSQDAAPAVKAALGVEGFVTGSDYRGVKVLASIRRVAGSPWSIVAKIDQAEVLAALRDRMWSLSTVLASLLAVAGAAGALLWRRQQFSFFEREYHSEQERRALRGRFDYLTRYANDVIVLMDPTGRFLEVNDRAVEVYGYSREELLRMSAADLRHLRTRAQIDEDWKAFEHDGGARFETWHQRKNGEAFPAEVSIRKIDIEGRRFVQSIIRDISERRRMEEDLRQANEKLLAMFQASPVAIIILNEEGTVSSWNPAAEAIFGWTAADVVGRPLPFVPAERMEEFDRLRHRVLQGEILTGLEVERMNKDGNLVWLGLSAAPLRNRDGEAIGAVALMVDLTARKRAERQLRESEERLELALEATSEGHWDWDMGRDAYYLSPRYHTMLGYEPGQIQPGYRHWAGMVHPDDLPIVERNLTNFLVSGQDHFRTEYRIQRRNGDYAWILSRGKVVARDESGKPLRMVGTQTDISEQKRLEEHFRQAQKMESVGRLAGGVAHDFNNHLTVINGYCDLLVGGLAPGDLMREQLLEIRKAGDRAASLTQQLLAFSRKQIIAPQLLDLNNAVRDVEKMLRRLIGDDVTLSVSLDASLGLVLADVGQMHQVLMNLAINARDAMPGGGPVLIETANVEVGEQEAARGGELPSGPYVRLTISDSGIGMDPETCGHIFEPFFTTKEEGAGTGLGLSTVYGIVKQSQGSIEVESTPGHGTTFRILLPRRDAAELPPDPAPPAAGIAPGEETILLVEDQSELRRLAARVLRSRGYRVLEAAHAAEAMEVCQRYTGPLHLLVTDVVMPGMNGRELASRLAGLQPDMKVLYVSGYSANELTRDGTLEQGLAYLAKPFSPDALVSRVREVLGPRDSNHA